MVLFHTEHDNLYKFENCPQKKPKFIKKSQKLSNEFQHGIKRRQRFSINEKHFLRLMVRIHCTGYFNSNISYVILNTDKKPCLVHNK